jgi:hypothetical protein
MNEVKWHPRYQRTARATAEFNTALADLIAIHDLSFGEILHMLGCAVSQWSKCLVREERADAETEGAK